MTEQRQPLHKIQFNGGLGKSIFPTFDVNVPMPSGTAVPPQVQVVSPSPSAGTAPASTGTAGSSQSSPRSTDR